MAKSEKFEGNKVDFICKSCGAVNTRDGKAHFRKLGRGPKKETEKIRSKPDEKIKPQENKTDPPKPQKETHEEEDLF